MSVNDRRQALDSRIEAFVFAVNQIGDQFLLEVSRAADTGSDRFDAMILAHDCAVPIPTNDSSTVLDVSGCQPSLRSNADMPPSCQSGDCVLCDTAACIHIHALCVPVLCVQWHSASRIVYPYVHRCFAFAYHEKPSFFQNSPNI